MIYFIVFFIVYMSCYFMFKVGDVVLIGMLVGVGLLLSGDELDICFNGEMLFICVL